MKRILLNATACLSLFSFVAKAQSVQPCATYEMQEFHKKNLPGYAAKIQTANNQIAAQYQAYLQSKSNLAAKTGSLDPSYQFTVPVVFHILHMNGSENINDADCVTALAQVNRDFARQGTDTNTIDPYFKPMYVNANIHFELAKLDPQGNCTNGIVHHIDANTNWGRDLYGYIYSTYGTTTWLPEKYLNIYIVKQIAGGGNGITVGYTYIPGTSPNYGSDAIVYRHDFLTGGQARSLSHEIGHWLGLSHTFGDTNNPGTDCGDDGIADTPKTTGFFSTCPKAGVSAPPPPVTNPNGTDIGLVKLGSVLSMTTTMNSLVGTTPYTSGSGTVSVTSTLTTTAKGVAGDYSDFSNVYPITVAANSTHVLTVTTLQSVASNNAIRVYIDKNRNGTFEITESVLNQTVPVMGPQTATASVTMPAAGLCRMRVIVNEGAAVTSPTMTVADGEYEDYMLNVGLIICDTIRPNLENIMDYSSCPKMFTKGQSDLMWSIAGSTLANRNNLSDTANLVLTGILTYSNGVYFPTPATPCAPVSDFTSNKRNACANQSVVYSATSFNSPGPFTYAWEFEGGSPATSTAVNPTINYALPGVYGVTLTTTNAQGSHSKSDVSYVHVFWNSDPALSMPIIHDFENGINNVDWYVGNPNMGSITWGVASYGSQGTSKSVMIPNANGNPTYDQIDVMETKAYDLSNVTNLTMSFDYAFARKAATVADTFKIQYSVDCGGSWKTLPGAPTTAAMASASGGTTTTAPFAPVSSSKWKTHTYSSAIMGVTVPNIYARDVKFRLYFRSDASGMSQNIYIDQINLSGVVSLNELANTIGLNIYPNPTNSSSSVDFKSPVNSKVNISVYDVTGRMIEESNLNANAGEMTTYVVNKDASLKAGIYFVTLSLDGQKVTRKLIIE